MKLAGLLISLCVAVAIACTGPSAPDPSDAEPDGAAAEAEEAGDESGGKGADDIDNARAAMPSVDYEPKKRIEPGHEEQSELARADLAKRLGVEADGIEVVQAQAVMWPNSGLGCPEADTMYMDVLTPGVLIRLRTGGEIYQYHAGRSSAPFLCETERARNPLPPGSYDDRT
jgi:hypothetical protein